MGVYDTFGDFGCQIKAGPCDMLTYHLGETVPLPDGVYVAYEGIIAVVGGVFVADFPTLIDKWGGEIDIDDVLKGANPVAQGIMDALNKREL